jgi:hypothetical protein
MRKSIFIFICLFGAIGIQAQEIKATVNINASRVGNNVNKNIFQTLQKSLTNFLNNRKWTNETYGPSEKIECNFFLNLESTSDLNVYSGSLTIQSARPIYNSSYLSPIVNFKDDNILFKYQEFQQLEFNENRVSGNDPQLSNLTALFAYYAYLIIGLDGDSFASHGGDAYFQKAQNIINNAPDGKNISGWKAFDGLRNRYWLIENLLNARYTAIHDVYYSYYRSGMDKFYSDENAARTSLLNTIQMLAAFNSDNPNTMINQFFFQGKTTELIKAFSRAAPQDKALAVTLLMKLDITNASKYKDELK